MPEAFVYYTLDIELTLPVELDDLLIQLQSFEEMPRIGEIILVGTNWVYVEQVFHALGQVFLLCSLAPFGLPGYDPIQKYRDEKNAAASDWDIANNILRKAQPKEGD